MGGWRPTSGRRTPRWSASTCGRTGLTGAATLAEACAADVILLSLPSDTAIDAVVLSAGGVREHASPGTVVVDLSTASPSATRKRHAALAERGVELLDAGVSGGPKGAEAGTLTLMVGGSEAALAQVRPVLLGIGKPIFHLGGPGTGHAAKAVNNYLNGVNLAAAAEAMVVGVKAGLDPELLLEVINSSSGRNWATGEALPERPAGPLHGGRALERPHGQGPRPLPRAGGGDERPALLGSVCRSVFGIAMARGYDQRVSNTVVDALADLPGGVRCIRGLGRWRVRADAASGGRGRGGASAGAGASASDLERRARLVMPGSIGAGADGLRARPRRAARGRRRRGGAARRAGLSLCLRAVE